MGKQIRLLIIEDSENDALLLLRRLRREGYDPNYERVEDVEGFSAALNKQEWDIIISDHSMPRFSAVKALEFLKERSLDIPVIIVSGTISANDAVAAMRAGASDYIMKDDLTRLIPAIEREIRERRARRSAEEQLRQAQKMESIGRLAGGVAHDFNNLLTAILGYCSLLIETHEANDPRKTDILEIKAAGERAVALTRQLLAFSRRQVFQLKVIDINFVVMNVERLLRRVIGEDIDLVTRLSPSVGHIKADPGQIEQVIMNLSVNAKDAMPESGKLIIETSNLDVSGDQAGRHFDVKPGPFVMLRIADTGSGMSEEVLAHLFEPFFTTKEKGKGTGLGLATVYGIVKQSNGNVWVESEPGRGTEFKIIFPRVEEALDVERRPAAPRKSLRGSESILLVEDDDGVRRLSSRILREKGYHVLEARDGQEALEICRDHKGTLHLLLTDMVMPQMSGEVLAKEVMRLRPQISVLYSSGYADNAIARKGVIEKGINFIQKPFAPEVLAQKIRGILDSEPGKYAK